MNFSRRNRSTSCALLDLLLDVQVLVVGDLLGDQRAEDLPADLHQLARGQVALQHPVVGAALVATRSWTRMPAWSCSQAAIDAAGSSAAILRSVGELAAAEHFERAAQAPEVQVDVDVGNEARGRGDASATAAADAQCRAPSADAR